ncbi:hypothetical protein GP486_004068 [Trichoglossum hirsutum]|uniref:Phenylalanine ammonia-lyase n=1 Tax=Trichoglossum hirsutum TaxID=265104 RepID=A0A9P8RPQ3_9PEZI|nr:hypothetical protein GP486_004068 [Trichoglossum hirsutum]
MSRRSHGSLVLAEWRKLQEILNRQDEISLDGSTLDVPSVVAVARRPCVVDPIHESVKFLQQELDQGRSLYGVTTGFGGSADTCTRSLHDLQTALLQMQICAVLPTPESQHPEETTAVRDLVLPNCDLLATLSMPEAWVRGAMLVRTNSLVRGHSAVRLSVIESIVTLLRENCVPLVPLRGSISASGDLCPLAYIAGALEGNPDVQLWTGDRGSRKLVPADQVLARLGTDPVSFGPKEGLGVLNGTAVSTAVAALALHEANHLAVLSQVLTAIGVEALSGMAGSFDPFVAKVRPHQGQTEVARNVSSFLRGSRLATMEDKRDNGQVQQDRYALRTSSQWLGPLLEDLVVSHTQLSLELNSTTDNPLIDAPSRRIHHGGNFQAVTVTSSTEKTRLALQMIGKLLFAQSTELLNVHLNNGLPPNLAADDPSLSYTLKGVDINMAAYMSELAFLANPVSNHVQCAEMGNQSINSLALVSARYTHAAVDVVSLMASAYLYSLCQALDLRVMSVLFAGRLRPAIKEITADVFGGRLPSAEVSALHKPLWVVIARALAATTTQDASDRFTTVATSAQPLLLEALRTVKDDPLSLLHTWTAKVAAASLAIFLNNRTDYLDHPDATPYLGAASKRIYKFVRSDLNIPLHRGLCDHPTTTPGQRKGNAANTGSRISVIHKALRTGKLMVPVMECLEEGLTSHRELTAKL